MRISKMGYNLAQTRLRLMSSWDTEEQTKSARNSAASPWMMPFAYGCMIIIPRAGPRLPNQAKIGTRCEKARHGFWHSNLARKIHLGRMAFEIEFPNHRSAGPQYIENLRAFVKKCNEAALRTKNDPPTVTELALSSRPPTEAPSEPRAITNEAIYFHGRPLGEGAFGKVRQVIRLRDGKVLAAKTL